MNTWSYQVKGKEVYENDVLQPGLWPQDLFVLERLATSGRIEYEGRDVKLESGQFLIRDQITQRLLFRASSPAHAMRWLTNVL